MVEQPRCLYYPDVTDQLFRKVEDLIEEEQDNENEDENNTENSSSRVVKYCSLCLQSGLMMEGFPPELLFILFDELDRRVRLVRRSSEIFSLLSKIIALQKIKLPPDEVQKNICIVLETLNASEDAVLETLEKEDHLRIVCTFQKLKLFIRLLEVQPLLCVPFSNEYQNRMLEQIFICLKKFTAHVDDDETDSFSLEVSATVTLLMKIVRFDTSIIRSVRKAHGLSFKSFPKSIEESNKKSMPYILQILIGTDTDDRKSNFISNKDDRKSNFISNKIEKPVLDRVSKSCNSPISSRQKRSYSKTEMSDEKCKTKTDNETCLKSPLKKRKLLNVLSKDVPKNTSKLSFAIEDDDDLLGSAKDILCKTLNDSKKNCSKSTLSTRVNETSSSNQHFQVIYGDAKRISIKVKGKCSSLKTKEEIKVKGECSSLKTKQDIDLVTLDDLDKFEDAFENEKDASNLDTPHKINLKEGQSKINSIDGKKKSQVISKPLSSKPSEINCKKTSNIPPSPMQEFFAGWQCTSCSTKNQAQRKVCKLCKLQRGYWLCGNSKKSKDGKEAWYCEKQNPNSVTVCSNPLCELPRGSWSCIMCTFHNKGTLSHCTMCGQRRPAIVYDLTL